MMKLSDYSTGLRHTYSRTLKAADSYAGLAWAWDRERVSLKDIGIRQPIVHFHLADNEFKNTVKEPVIPFFGPGKWTWDRKSSSGSVLSDSSRKSSLDGFGRKYSDASLHFDWSEGRRRSSDASVLNEDTDSFIIGDRVWVGGTKPGQIAYLGETQFAPGEWAGVVLDDPIGKNDGSVANIRYFQCEPRKGVFSRLTRLTRYPLSDIALKSPSPSTNAPLQSPKSPVNETPVVAQKRSSITKPASPDSALHPNVNIGDRVIVMSAQGSKAGVLKFKGATDFAPGEWAGVELDDPLGKNDGSVAGTRYFECRPHFGLFAPLHKVSKSPANRRVSQQNNCQIHRRGSRESLVSNLSSLASNKSSTPKKISTVRVPLNPVAEKNALQEALKERDTHIEKLIKERELERTETSKTAEQITELQKNFETALVTIENLKIANEKLSLELSEEQRRVEDLQFRIAEESVVQSDDIVDDVQLKIETLTINFAEKEKQYQSQQNCLEIENKRLINDLNDLKSKLKTVEEQFNDLNKNLITNQNSYQKLSEEYAEINLKNENLIKIQQEGNDSVKQKLLTIQSENEVLNKELVTCQNDYQKLTQEYAEINLKYESKLKIQQEENDSIEQKLLTVQSENEILNEKLVTFQNDYQKLTQECAEINLKYESKLKIQQEENDSIKQNLLTIQSDNGILNEKLVTSQNDYQKLTQECAEQNLNYENKLKTQQEENNSLKEKLLSVQTENENLNANFVKQQNDYELSQKEVFDLQSSNERANKELDLFKNELLKTEKIQTLVTEKENHIESLNRELSEHKSEIVQFIEKLNDSEKKKKKVETEFANLQEKIIQLQCENDKNKEMLINYETNINALTQNVNFLSEEKNKIINEKSIEIDTLNNKLKSIQEENYMLQQTLTNDKDKLLILNKEQNEKFQNEIALANDNLNQLKHQLDENQIIIQKLNEDLELNTGLVKNQNTILNDLEQNHKKLLEEKVILEKEKNKIENELANSQFTNNEYKDKLLLIETQLQEKSKSNQVLEENLNTVQYQFKDAKQNILLITEQRNKAENDIKSLIAASGNNNLQLEQLQAKLNERSQENDQLRQELNNSKEIENKLNYQLKERDENVKMLENKIAILHENETISQNQYKEMTEKLKRFQDDILNSEKLFKELECSKNNEVTKLNTEIEEKSHHLNKFKEEMNEILRVKEELNSKLEKATNENLTVKNNLERSEKELKVINEQSNFTLINLNKFTDECNELKNKNTELSNLLEKTTEENLKLKNEINVTSEQSNIKLLENQEISSKLLQLDEKSRELANLLLEAQQQKKMQIEEIENLKQNFSLQESELNNKITHLTAEITNFNNENTKFKKEIIELNEALNMHKNIEANLKHEFLNVNQKNNELVNLLETTKSQFNNEIDNLNIQIKDLTAQLNIYKSTEEKLSQNESELIEKLKIFENNNAIFKKEIFELNSNKEILLKDLQTNLNEIESLKLNNQNLQSNLASINTEKNNLIINLNLNEKKLIDVTKNVEELTILNNELNKHNGELNSELDNLRDQLKTVFEMNDKLENKNLQLEELINNKKVPKDLEAKQLQSDLNYLNGTVNNLKIERDVFEKMVNTLKLNLKEKDDELEKLRNQNSSPNGNTSTSDEMGDRLQIDFLNSVIVDMQMKNQALKTKIEALELGITTEELEEYRLDQAAGRTVAPRLFCDICDMFDLHDTEDCPKQATDNADEPQPIPSNKPRKVPEPRPYCENCEIFGHDTADCDEAETF